MTLELLVRSCQTCCRLSRRFNFNPVESTALTWYRRKPPLNPSSPPLQDQLPPAGKLQPRLSSLALRLPCPPYDVDGHVEEHATWQPEKITRDRLRVQVGPNVDGEGLHTDGSEELTPRNTPRCERPPRNRFVKEGSACEGPSKKVRSSIFGNFKSSRLCFILRLWLLS
jgi:hypothetical protein